MGRGPARQDAAAIDNLAGWLTTVVGRVCLDVLRSRRTRAELSYEDRLPELVVTVDGGAAPEDDAMLAESVGLALLVVLDTLTPTERLAFVLHDMFAVPFVEIGEIVGRSTDATKMLVSRARRKVQGTPPPEQEPQRRRAVVDAFLTRSGPRWNSPSRAPVSPTPAASPTRRGRTRPSTSTRTSS
ncbi:sigma factor-like helix-turn-helix DNA-binding protein [Actinomadura sp. NPDC000600]|uniref:sigma factor-like helix-turn-helix DNA-binding protein n=1 Tax=Actinomadura sp. NPDC000600 TaxID=3154262 RepID=UPI003396B2F7